MNEIFKFICGGLCAISVGFIFIELRTRFDRFFLYFGISTLLTSVFSAFDIWGFADPNKDLMGLTAQHCIISLFPIVMVMLIFQIAKKKKNIYIFLFLSSGFLQSFFFATGLMLSLTDNVIVLKPLYYYCFIPYLILSSIILPFILFRFYIQLSISKKFFFAILTGCSALAICGFLDMLTLLTDVVFIPSLKSMTSIGSIIFCSILVYVFSEKLIQLIKSNTSYQVLQLINKDLNNARSIVAAGKSTVIINHEMKNYLFSITYHVEKILSDKNLPETTHSEARRIISIVNELLYLNYDLLDIPQKQIIDSFPIIEVTQILQNCLKTTIRDKAHLISVENSTVPFFMHGDTNRVKDAFCTLSNLLLNHSEKIRITLTKDSFVFLMTFTTIFPKKLAAPVKIEDEDLVFSSIRSIFESFGGNVTQIKNHLDHTIIDSVYVTVPNYFDSPTLLDKEKDKVALIMEGLENIETVTQIFRNVFVNPYVMKNHEDLDKKIDIIQCKIIGSNKCINAIQKAYPESDCFTLTSSSTEGLSITRHGTEETENFSESFILHNLIKSR